MAKEPLPPALPPESRTVGQLVAESIHLYRRRFWWALLIGLPVAALDQASAGFSVTAQTAFVWAFAPRADGRVRRRVRARARRSAYLGAIS